jgi:hypothetical protein
MEPKPGHNGGPPLDDDDEEEGNLFVENNRTGRLMEIWKPEELHAHHDGEFRRRIARRRAIRHLNKEFLADWRKTKNRWDGGSGSIRKEDLEAVTKPICCASCGNWFPAARSDAKTCSQRCRVALHRANKANGNKRGALPV